MSFKPIIQRYAFAPTAVALATATIALFPKSTLHAESVELGSSESKKPIYDDYEDIPSPTQSPTATTPSSSPSPKPSSSLFTTTKPGLPTPTQRLASQIGKTRLFLHSHIVALENGVNNTMTSALNLENSFTSTVASLAPSPQSGERLMPGSIYVLVAAMTGSILARNRNIVLRGVTPLAVGIGAGWVALPVTMTNVSDLLWKYEKRFPAVAELHLRTKSSLQSAWEMTKSTSRAAKHKVDEKVEDSREAVEGWVKQGK